MIECFLNVSWLWVLEMIESLITFAIMIDAKLLWFVAAELFIIFSSIKSQHVINCISINRSIHNSYWEWEYLDCFLFSWILCHSHDCSLLKIMLLYSCIDLKEILSFWQVKIWILLKIFQNLQRQWNSVDVWLHVHLKEKKIDSMILHQKCYVMWMIWVLLCCLIELNMLLTSSIQYQKQCLYLSLSQNKSLNNYNRMLQNCHKHFHVFVLCLLFDQLIYNDDEIFIQ